jgi:hypothetical protein
MNSLASEGETDVNTKYEKPTGRKLLVILNGPFGVALLDDDMHSSHHGDQQLIGGSVLVYAADVPEHVCTINRQPWQGTDHALQCVESDPKKRTLLDYGLANGRVFEVDFRRYTFNGRRLPLAGISLPFPNFIYPHRLIDIAFRDGVSAGPHHAGVPTALVLEYRDFTSPIVRPDNIGPLPGQELDIEFDFFYLYAGPKDDSSDDNLTHARHAWFQFTRNWKGLTCELFGATMCDPANSVKDPAGLEDTGFEKFNPISRPTPTRSGAIPNEFNTPKNCKNQLSFITNATAGQIVFAGLK